MFQYLFVVTTLWLGFVAAISFMETPLRFQADEVPREHSLAIGNLVFHYLNGAEIIFGSITLLGLFMGTWTAACRTTAFAALSLLTFQTWMLFAILDERTLATIRGEEVPTSHWHSVYIGCEGIKLLILIILLVMQIQQYRRNLIAA